MSRKRARSPTPPTTSQTFKSASIEDRSSTFIAIFSPTYSSEALQSLPEFKNASHRMAAWRRPSKQQRSLNSQPVFETGYDDDGENFGGKTLEKVLIAKNIAGAVMVARWYGGVMLGPVRFDHIKNCAGDAIARWAQDGERAAKRAKMEGERRRLTEVLSERDQSIDVLRGLLAEKKHGLVSDQCSETHATSSPSAKTPEYTTMELPVLQRLEQVRDKTIGWILGQIEEVEKALGEASNLRSDMESEAAEKAVKQKSDPVRPAAGINILKTHDDNAHTSTEGS